jgi:membrane protein
VTPGSLHLVGAVSAVDGFQRRHPVLGFPLAVIYKYFDDQGPYLASALTYYAFIAIFPLMLLGTSILGLILRGEPNWQEAILDSALAQFPIIGDELGRPAGLQGSVAGVAVGAIAALYGAMGLGQALQNTQHVAWSVPRNSRPNPIYARVKTLVLLLTAGFSLLAVSVVSTIATTTDLFADILGDGLKYVLPLLTVAVVGTFLTLLFRYAATGQHSFLRSAPGGFTLAVLWQLLQLGGSVYVDRVLVDTTSMTKTFGLVLGLIGFLWIGAVMAVLSMEINVVLTRRLWPRALLTPFTDNVELTEADRRAYASYARMQRHKGFEKVLVTWEPRLEGSPQERKDEPEPVQPGPEQPQSTSPST